MKNIEVKGLLSQLRTAAGAIKAQIHEADSQIAALNEQRRALTDAPVSKSDFMAYVRADIERRAVSYRSRMKLWERNYKFPFSFTQLERTHTREDLQPFPYLDGETPHNGGELDAGALYWHFGDLLAERFSNALDSLQWPADVVSVADRRLQIAEIDAKLKELNAKREEWANDLISSGMYE
jgi:hypothetical protein